MKRLGFLAMGVLLSGSALATTTLIPTNMNFRVGVAYAFEDVTRDITGNMFAIGVDFNSNISLIRGSRGFLTVDYLTGALDGDKGYILPVLWNQQFGLGREDMYFFAGLGIVNLDIVRGKTVFGGRVGAGMNLGERTFVEASYLFSEEVENARADSLQIMFGIRL